MPEWLDSATFSVEERSVKGVVISCGTRMWSKWRRRGGGDGVGGKAHWSRRMSPLFFFLFFFVGVSSRFFSLVFSLSPLLLSTRSIWVAPAERCGRNASTLLLLLLLLLSIRSSATSDYGIISSVRPTETEQKSASPFLSVFFISFSQFQNASRVKQQ